VAHPSPLACEESMARPKAKNTKPCPHCGCTSVRKNGRNHGRQRWHCSDCGKTFGETYGTPLYGLHASAEEVARTLLVVMRRGSLSAAEEITGHKYETISKWLRRAGEHGEALTHSLVHELKAEEVEVDAFWSFVGNAVQALQTSQVRHKRWASRLGPVPAGGV
jgi:transposase-like protein